MAWWMLLSSATFAHGVVEDRASVQLSGARARVAATLPASHFSWADDDRDGLLSAAEVAAHRDAILAAGADAFRLSDGQGASPEPTLQDAVLPGDALDGAAHLTLMMGHRFAEPPEVIDLRVALPEPMALRWVDGAAPQDVALPAGGASVRLRGGRGPQRGGVLLALAVAAGGLLWPVRRRWRGRSCAGGGRPGRAAPPGRGCRR